MFGKELSGCYCNYISGKGDNVLIELMGNRVFQINCILRCYWLKILGYKDGNSEQSIRVMEDFELLIVLVRVKGGREEVEILLQFCMVLFFFYDF